MIRKALILFLIGATPISGMRAQDMLPSTSVATPWVINPALLTAGQLQHRAGVFHRQQWQNEDLWFGPSSAFSSIGAYTDAAFLEDRLPQAGGSSRGGFNRSRLAIGLGAWNDYTTARTLSLTRVGGSLAYQQALSARHELAAGFSMQLFQKRLDTRGLIFEDMVGQDGVIPGLPSNDQFVDARSSLDLAAGLAWRGRFLGQGRIPGTDKLRMEAGVAWFHLNRPSVSFTGEREPIAIRTTAHWSAKYEPSQLLIVIPRVLYAHNGPNANHMIQYGAYLGTRVEPAVLYAGVLHTANQGIAYQLATEYRNTFIGFALETAQGSIGTATSGLQTFEVSVVHYWRRKGKGQTDCPTF
jgi:type IX secretion system PorP/SprF family membrane protein